MLKIRFPQAAQFFGLFLIFFNVQLPVFGQTEQCGTNWVTDHYQKYFPQKTAPIPEFPNSPITNRTVVTIPVVVHVVHFWSFENISKEQIESQIAVLNADFRKLNANFNQTPAEFKTVAADCQLEFCLASKDPFGAPTDGITRTKTNVSVIGSKVENDGRLSIKHSDTGGEDAWNESKYLNIWVGGLQSGLFGFATFPATAPAGEDGVVIDPRYFGTVGLAASSAPQNLGRTATHEVGHYFNLKHIWGNVNGCNEDDDVADTPQSEKPFSVCPVHPQFSCGNKAMFMNYMDYTDDGCMTMFSAGQRDRMLAALNGPRASLLTSNGCGTLSTQVIENQDITLWPNPATGQVFIKNIFEKDGAVTVRNALGQPVFCTQNWSAGQVELNVSGLATGFYVVGNGFFQKIFIKSE